ncbi:phosphate ABC transporter substrate-binding protein PstS [Nonomuraea antimicrobica]|uniref:Phosphate-binding protein n=2 Tax=Nonomuraea antimicrobica TaxID=561173 RepID=A0ABP7CC82_9ACTN
MLKRLAGQALVAALVLGACAAGVSGAAVLSRDDDPPKPPIAESISGSGSSAQEGAMDAWRAEFHRIHPDLEVQYKSSGSGAGIDDFISGRTALAGSDVAMRPDEQVRANRRCGRRAVHLPMVVGRIALAYNLPSVPDLRLSPATAAGIFGGRITRWDDPRVAAENPGAPLPRTRIRLFHRSDDSGTTHNFTAYLKAAGRWPHEPSRKWTGKGKGVAMSAGVIDAVRDTKNSIGYVEYGLATNAGLSTAQVRNAGGEFVQLTPESAATALENARVVGEDGDLVVQLDYLTRAKGAYPIVLVTYAITCQPNRDPLVRAFLLYAAGDAGQSSLALYGYAPLPRDLLTRVRVQLDAMDDHTTTSSAPTEE